MLERRRGRYKNRPLPQKKEVVIPNTTSLLTKER